MNIANANAGSSWPPDSTPLNYSAIQLDVDMSKIKTVGHQAPGSNSCSCFALAYARTITDGYVHKYYEYNDYGNNEYTVNANWPKGNYYGAGYETKKEIFFFMYKDLQNGKPVIAYASGARSQKHYVTVVGVCNVTSYDDLSEKIF